MSKRAPATKNGFWLLLAGTLTAVGASACCLIPLTLLTLGIGGSWLGSLSLLEPYRPLFIGATLLFLTFAFYRIYLAPSALRNKMPAALASDGELLLQQHCRSICAE